MTNPITGPASAPDMQASVQQCRAEETYSQVDRLDAQIDDARGLSDALELVCWHLCQETFSDPHLAQMRKAILGLSAALNRVLTP